MQMVLPTDIIDQYLRHRREHTRSLVVMLRGVSGSGKSTFADRLCRYAAQNDLSARICGADDYMDGPNGYQWSPSRLQSAHAYCQDRCARSLRDHVDVICIDNTNITQREMFPYIQMCERQIMRVVTFRCGSLDQAMYLARRSGHSVPPRVVERRFREFIDANRNFEPQFWQDVRDVAFISVDPE